MAKKATVKSRSRTGAKAAMAKHKDVPAPKKKAAFGKRSKAASVAHTALPKSTAAKSTAKPARKSTIGKVVDTAVGAVTSTVSSVAGQATSLFNRDRAGKTR